MARAETCGLHSTDEEIEVYVALDDNYIFNEMSDNPWKSIKNGKRIVGIYNRLQDLKTAKKWNNDIKYFEKCKLKITKIEDVTI